VRAQFHPLGMTAALLACGLALAFAAPAAAGWTEDPTDCTATPSPPTCSPEDVAKQRTAQAAHEADLRRRYDEQQALTVPATKADLTLLCAGDTVQIWFQASLLAWGIGERREVWRLDRVTPTEITWKRVLQGSWTGRFFDATGYINRVTGQFSLGTDVPAGQCGPVQPKF
jgi:hypothetical protein